MKISGYLFLGLLLLSMTFIKCECKDHEEEGTCYSFDRRQCDGDEWSEIVPINDTEEEQEEKMKAYLEGKGITVLEVNVISDFHEFVCEACFVCPIGDRFFVKIEEDDAEKLADLELLSLEEDDCGSF